MASEESTSRKLVENTALTLIARISMALTLPVVTFLFILLQMVYSSDLKRIEDAAKADNNLTQQMLLNHRNEFDRQMGDVLKRLGELTTLSNNSLLSFHQNQNRISILESNRAQDTNRMATMENTITAKFDKLSDQMNDVVKRLTELSVESRGVNPKSKQD